MAIFWLLLQGKHPNKRIGPPSVDKTHLATVLPYEAPDKGYTEALGTEGQVVHHEGRTTCPLGLLSVKEDYPWTRISIHSGNFT